VGETQRGTFSEKKVLNKDGQENGYIYSRLWLNRYLKEIGEWNIDNIKKRYELILERFLQIRKYPDIEINEEDETDEDYNIFNAPDPKFKKLDYFIYKDEKVITNDFSKMYYHVITDLFKDNPSAFSHPDIKRIAGLSNNPKDLRAPFKIDSSYYMESNIDNNTKFRRLKTLLAKFDMEDELIINYSNGREDTEPAEVDRTYWEGKSSRKSMDTLDAVFKIINEANPNTKLNYKRWYVGLALISKHLNLARLYPKQSFLKVYVFLPEADEWIMKMKDAGLLVYPGGREPDRFKFKINYEDVIPNRELLKELFVAGYGYCLGD